jgi:hypothetical protein
MSAGWATGQLGLVSRWKEDEADVVLTVQASLGGNEAVGLAARARPGCRWRARSEVVDLRGKLAV